MLLWADGFDHYSGYAEMLNGSYAEAGGYSGPSTTVKRTGTKSMLLDGLADSFRKVLPAAKTAVGVGCAIYPKALPSGNNTNAWFMALSDFDNVNQVHFVVASTGHLQAFRSGNGTPVLLAQSSAPVIVANAFQHLEMYVEFSDTVGKVRVRVNNVEVINVSNVDTVTTARVEASNVKFNTANNNTIAYYLDDFYIYDTSGTFNNAYPIGDMQCLALYPNADTAVADFTKSTGTVGFSLINDLSDATYIQSTAAAQKSEFELDDLPANITYIAGLCIHNRINKSDAGVAQMQASILSGASVANGADRVMTTQATYWADVIEQDPATAARWTRLAINAAKLRLTRTV